MKTAVAAPPEDHDPRPLYVLQLEELVRVFDKAIAANQPFEVLIAEMKPWMVEIIERLRDEG